MYAVVELLLQTGMRISELAAMQLTDVDFERNIITITLRIREVVARCLSILLAKKLSWSTSKFDLALVRKPFFLTKTCRPFWFATSALHFDRYFRLAGIKDAKVNDLRHTFIAEQLKAGTPLVYVSQLVGHKRITTRKISQIN